MAKSWLCVTRYNVKRARMATSYLHQQLLSCPSTGKKNGGKQVQLRNSALVAKWLEHLVSIATLGLEAAAEEEEHLSLDTVVFVDYSPSRICSWMVLRVVCVREGGRGRKEMRQGTDYHKYSFVQYMFVQCTYCLQYSFVYVWSPFMVSLCVHVGPSDCAVVLYITYTN